MRDQIQRSALRSEHFRRTRRIAAALAAAGLAVVGLPDPGAAEPAGGFTGGFNSGTGTAVATAYRVNPLFGNLSFGITVGEALAGHQNQGAQAVSSSIDLGVIGDTLAQEGCDGGEPTLPSEHQPQPVIAESNDPQAAEGHRGNEELLIEKFARAKPTPFAEAVTTVGPLGAPAVAAIQGARTTATSGVVAEGVRQARALTEIASVELLEGLVRLGGLRWEAVHRSGAEELAEGTFSLGSLTVAGQAVPLPTDPAGQLAQLDAVLREVGFEVSAPQIRVEQGIVFVDPMTLGIVPSERRDSLLGPVFSAIQPFREQLTAALLRAHCGAATFITVADLALGTFSGAGALRLELGGVRATTAELNLFRFPALAPLPDLAPVAPVAPVVPVGPLGAGTSAGPLGTPTFGGAQPAAPSPASSGGAPGGAAPEATASAAPPTQQVTPIAGVAGARGGAMAAIGGLGLALLALAAEADRRKMRRAMREIPEAS